MINMNPKIRDIVMIALFVAISSLTRIGMSYLPNIQLSTGLIILITLNYGLKYGLTVAVLTPLVSNMILGQGIWTAWQMVSWSLIVLISIPFRKYKDNIYIVGLLAIFSGYLFGFTISIQSALTYGLYNVSFIAYYIVGISFDTLHAIGNTVFCVIILERFNLICEKYKERKRGIYE